MSRKPRLHLPDGFYHVMLRGNGGQDIFFTKADRLRFLELLAEGVERFDTRLHGFCLMSNHVHLVVQAGAVPLSRPMQNLAFRYTRFLNARKRRVGHLFQGRYKAILVDADRYLLELLRYVHLNPVRGGLVARPEDWPWSAHRAYLGDEDLSWLTTEAVLARFAKRLGTARARYRVFVEEGMGEGRRAEFHEGGPDSRVLADEAFLERVTAAAERPRRPPDLDTLIAQVAAAYGVAPSELATASRRRPLVEARGVIGHLARESGAASLTEVARRFGRDLTTLSHGVRHIELRAGQDSALAQRIEALNNATLQA